jgi:hypothetical protein
VERTYTPCTDGFDTVAIDIVAIPPKRRPPVIQAVEEAAGADHRLTAADRAILTQLLGRLYWRDGYTYVGVDRLAADAARSRRSTITALRRLVECGYALRRVVQVADVRRVTVRGETTLPALVTAYRRLISEGRWRRRE